MLESVKVKCIFLGYHKSIVGNKLWRLDDVTSKVVFYRNMGFNESGEYKKTFIGSGVGTGSMQVLHALEFGVEPLGDHTFEVEPQENIDEGAGLLEVQTQDLMDYQLARDREQHLACKLFGYREDSNQAAFAVAAVEKIYAHKSLTFNNTVACDVIFKRKAGLKDDMDARLDVYVLSNGCRKCSDDNDGYYWGYTPGMFTHLFLYIDDMVFSCGCKAEIWATKSLLDKAKGNILGMEITLLEGHSILSLEGSLLGDCDVKKNGKWSCIYAVGSQEYQMVCMILGIASAYVGMLNKFDRGLQTDVQVFVDFDYAMGRSITVMGLEEGNMVKGLLTESRYELRAMTEVLSQKILTGRVVGICRSLRRELSHVISQEQSSRALYSASVEDLDITDCFLDYHEIKLLPRKIPNTETDILEEGQFAQSLSRNKKNISSSMEGVTPSVVDMTVETEMQNSLDDNTVPDSFPPLSTLVTSTAGNAPDKYSYANITGKTSGKKVNVRTLFTPGGNGIDVVVPVDSIRAISERFANTAYDVSTVPIWVKLHGVPVTAFNEDGLSAITIKLGTPLMLDSYTSDMCMQSWGRSSYARVMTELRADVELKDNIVVAMPKITKEGHYTCNVRVEYEWKPPRSCKVFGHIHEECPKNTGAGEKKTVKKPSQTSRGVLVGQKIGFTPQKEYRPVLKKPNASSSGNKKKGVQPTIEVSNSNPFDVLNSIDNDVEFGTNGGTTNLVNNRVTSSRSFMNINNDGEFASNTPIGEKIDKIERQICKGKLRLLDNDRNSLVPTSIVESDCEVEVVFDKTANLRISMSDKDESDKGYGTNSLLEQLRDFYPDNDDYDPYDDDMYENHDLSEHLQSICDDLDITASGRKKK
nr:hypothetical protein [Tanacetum cinerariifolium]